MAEIQLTGCPFQPMSAYLKALAIFRLVAEQADTNARAFWDNEYFVLVSKLEKPDLVDFFLNRYRPTPVLAPWNGGSGFYAPRIEKSG